MVSVMEGMGACEMMVWCGEKEECQCVVIHCIPGMFHVECVWTVVVEWRERRVVWRKVVEGKRRKSGKPKNTNPIATLKKATTLFD